MQHEGTDAKGPKSTGTLTQAALLGLCGGILLGGLLLLGVGLQTRLSPADCTGLSEMECAFTREAAREVSRMQVIVGSGLLALGASVVALLRSKARPASS